MRKFELMYAKFGKADGKCKDCKHFVTYRYHDRYYRKCKVYGVSSSEGTDWKASADACGLFNQDTKHENVFRLVKGGKKKEETQIDGQMSLF